MFVGICYKQSTSYQKIRIGLCPLFVLLSEKTLFDVPNTSSLSTAWYGHVFLVDQQLVYLQSRRKS